MDFTYIESEGYEYVNSFSIVKNKNYENPDCVFLPISDGKFGFKPKLEVKLLRYEVTETYCWELFPYKSGPEPRQTTAFKLKGIGMINGGMKVCILEDETLYNQIPVTLWVDPACVIARTTLYIGENSPEFVVWIPAEGFNQLLVNLRTLSDPTLYIRGELNLGHVYISDRDIQRCFIDDDRSDMTLNLFRYPKKVLNYNEIPEEMRKVHIDQRPSQQARVSISFTSQFGDVN